MYLPIFQWTHPTVLLLFFQFAKGTVARDFHLTGALSNYQLLLVPMEFSSNNLDLFKFPLSLHHWGVDFLFKYQTEKKKKSKSVWGIQYIFTNRTRSCGRKSHESVSLTRISYSIKLSCFP